MSYLYTLFCVMLGFVAGVLYRTDIYFGTDFERFSQAEIGIHYEWQSKDSSPTIHRRFFLN